MKTLVEINKIWAADKEAFQSKEIGGLQSFVKDVLESKDLFNLKQGYESTTIENRQNEFTIEHTKKGHRADFVIFIKGNEIVIPVEVEKHNNIEKGRDQLFQYQKDWNKKYGILTDGNQWRFYRSSQYRSFSINEILINPKTFISYWNFYIQPENYYIELFNPSGQLFLFNDKLNLNIAQNKIIFFDEITQVINNFKGKMEAIGAFGDLFDYQQKDKIAVETSYAYLIQFILYKVLVDNKYKKFNDEFNRMLSKVQKAIMDKDFYSIIINEIKNISEYISTYIYIPFKNEQKSINEKLISNLRSDLSIDDVAPWLDIILFINRYDFSGLKNEIFGYIYENFLKDLFNQGNKGQYFTDPAVVNFMLDAIGYQKDEILDNVSEDKISIIDPSCGAGTFLYSSVDRIIDTFDNGTKEQSKFIENLVDKNIFGLDIAEFPLFLSEMSILMRLLPLIVNDNYENPIENKLKIFKTKDSITEFLDTGISTHSQVDLFAHLEKTALDYPSFMRDQKDLEEMLNSLQEKSGARERFDYVIGNPPYIGLNKCYNDGVEFTKLLREKNKDGTSNQEKSLYLNDVYGVNLHSIPDKPKKGRPNPNLYAFFIALGLALLKDNGKICYIIPQTILVDTDYDVLRYHLSKFTTIEQIITFEGKMFIGRGLKQNRPVPTSSLIFVVKKKTPDSEHLVKIVNYNAYLEDDGVDFTKYFETQSKNERTIKQSELLTNLNSWNLIKRNETLISFISYYIKNSENISIYYNHKEADVHFKNRFYFDGGYSIDERLIKKEKDVYIYPKINNNYFKIKNIKGYWPNIRKGDSKYTILLRQGSQGYNLLESKYKVIWSYANTKIFCYTDKPVVWARNQMNAIGSSNKYEILYLLALLNSSLSSCVINTMMKAENEETLTIAIGLKNIKSTIRVPKINEQNKFIKDEIVKFTEYLLTIEDYVLKDLVEFTTTIQKFSSVKVKSNELIITDCDGNKIIETIKSKPSLVKSIIDNVYKQNILNETHYSLHDLKFLEVIDVDEQKSIKNYIDDLVFALYFSVPVREIGIIASSKLKKECESHKFYKLVSGTTL